MQKFKPVNKSKKTKACCVPTPPPVSCDCPVCPAGPQGPPGVNGTNGINGTNGSNGAQGLPGQSGPVGPPAVIQAAQYAHFGAQPLALIPGAPLLFNTTVFQDPGISRLSTGGGSAFSLANTGRYEVSFSLYYIADAAVVLYQGATTASMSPVTYTRTGKVEDGIVARTFMIEVMAGTVISLNASPTNSGNLQPGATAATGNQSVATISIKQINPPI